MIGERIKRARRAAGLSQRELALAADLSPMAVSKFEAGTITPASDTLLRLARALQVRVEFLLRPGALQLEAPEYRKRSSLGKKKLASIEADVLDQVERFQELLHLYPSPPIVSFGLPAGLPTLVSAYDELEAVALLMREVWQLGYSAIPSLADTLEERGLLVLTTPQAGDGVFDGLAAKVGDLPVIVVGASWPGDRQRFTMAHELGHLVLAGRLASSLDAEKACNRFAGAFLAPEPAVRAELGPVRHRFEPRELHTLKQRYGLSMLAWVFRARNLGIASEAIVDATFRRFSAAGWRKLEPGGPVPPETPRLFEQLVMRALAEDMLSESKAAELLRLRTSDFRERLALEGLDGADRP